MGTKQVFRFHFVPSATIHCHPKSAVWLSIFCSIPFRCRSDFYLSTSLSLFCRWFFFLYIFFMYFFYLFFLCIFLYIFFILFLYIFFIFFLYICHTIFVLFFIICVCVYEFCYSAIVPFAWNIYTYIPYIYEHSPI